MEAPSFVKTAWRPQNRRAFSLYFLALSTALAVFVFLLPSWKQLSRPTPSQHVIYYNSSEAPELNTIDDSLARPSAPSPPPKDYAIGIFLGADHDKKEYDTDYADWYFIGARILAYQLLHCPATKLRTPIPLVILVSKDVSERKRQRLREDGAIVTEVQHVPHNLSDKITTPRWKETFTKIRMFDPAIMPYKKVLMMDTDMVITRPIDGIFHDKSSTPAKTQLDNVEQGDTAFTAVSEFSKEYVYSTSPETMDYDHPFPFYDTENKIPNFNSALALYTPSASAFQYYLEILARPELFFNALPDQDLLNYAHRRGGPMPWNTLDPTWYINWPTPADIDGGMAILHSKFWFDEHYREVQEYCLSRRWEMEGYWMGREGKSHANYATNNLLGD
ncbi:hypothetical protein NUU61_003938 [Penicillium alfredii]|uniref:Nucleotide-diphospho-sugar transferase n=1 Tax=Penicillium alfredii TaxID=1506179 RepID=A0A9W9KDC1_9EURO|nr:uncharacterized protein NUU61_003938 [Penicillium alfredii]KAJ5101716.1 hypothetical protein NUU61_003938 [Penicillium alfredii]